MVLTDRIYTHHRKKNGSADIFFKIKSYVFWSKIFCALSDRKHMTILKHWNNFQYCLKQFQSLLSSEAFVWVFLQKFVFEKLLKNNKILASSHPVNHTRSRHRWRINSDLLAKYRPYFPPLYQQFKLFAVTICTSIYSFSCFLHVWRNVRNNGISVPFHLCKQALLSSCAKQGINKTWQNKQSTIFRDHWESLCF